MQPLLRRVQGVQRADAEVGARGGIVSEKPASPSALDHFIGVSKLHAHWSPGEHAAALEGYVCGINYAFGQVEALMQEMGVRGQRARGKCVRCGEVLPTPPQYYDNGLPVCGKCA